MKFKGRVYLCGDHIDTDVIIPARYLNTSDEKELASHCMEDLDKDFSKKIIEGDIIVAGSNFGCGSSREHAPIAIKASGISVVVAKSFARIFFRNSVNIGLPILTYDYEALGIENGDEIIIDFDEGKIENVTKGKMDEIESLPDFMKEIFNAGGLMPYINER